MRELLRHVGVYGLSDATLAALGLVSTPILTRLFAPAEYGVRELIANATFFLFPILLLGLDSALPSFYMEPALRERRSILVSTAFAFVAAWSIALALLVIVLLPTLEVPMLASQGATAAFRFAVAGAVPLVMVAFGKYVLRFQFAASAFVQLAVFTGVAVTATGLIFAGTGRTVADLYLGQLIGGLTAAVVALRSIRADLGRWFSLPLLGQLLRSGVVFLPGTLLYIAFTIVDRQVIALFGTASDVGVYALGVRVATIPVALLTVLSMAWIPLASRRYHEGPGYSAYFNDALRYATLAFVSLALVLTAFAREIVAIAAPDTYRDAARVVAPLTFASALASLGTIAAVGVFIMRRGAVTILLNGLALVVNLVVALQLLPLIGVLGAAFAVLLGQSVWAVGHLIVTPRILPEVRWDLRRSMLTLGVGVVFMALVESGGGEGVSAGPIYRTAVVGFFVATLFVMRLVGPRELGSARQLLRTVTGSPGGR